LNPTTRKPVLAIISQPSVCSSCVLSADTRHPLPLYLQPFLLVNRVINDAQNDATASQDRRAFALATGHSGTHSQCPKGNSFRVMSLPQSGHVVHSSRVTRCPVSHTQVTSGSRLTYRHFRSCCGMAVLPLKFEPPAQDRRQRPSFSPVSSNDLPTVLRGPCSARDIPIDGHAR
jgi:hypothetical protein